MVPPKDQIPPSSNLQYFSPQKLLFEKNTAPPNLKSSPPTKSNNHFDQLLKDRTDRGAGIPPINWYREGQSTSKVPHGEGMEVN